jgi:ABC-type long-subunit fatty acid transport system fused permease/ATPase subunit
MIEKLGVSFIGAVSLMLIVLIMVLFFSQTLADSVEATGFVKGIVAALICCLAGLIASLKHRKR